MEELKVYGIEPYLADSTMESAYMAWLAGQGLSNGIGISGLAENLDSIKNNLKKIEALMPQQNTIAIFNVFYSSIDQPAQPQVGEAPSNFMDIGIQSNISIKGLPIRISARGAFVDGQFYRQLSDFSVDYDFESYIHRYREKLALEAINSPESPFRFTGREKSIIQKKMEFAFLRSRLNSPGFFEKKAELEKKAGELRNIENISTEEEELLMEYNKQLARADSIVSRYRSLVEYLDGASEGELQQIRSKTEGLKTEIASLADPEKVISKYNNRGLEGSTAKKALFMVRGFNLGLFQGNCSELTINQLPLTGAQAIIKKNNVFAELGVGRKNTQLLLAGFQPEPFLRRRPSGQRIFYSSIGFGLKDGDHLKVTALRGWEPTRELGNTPSEIDNLVFSLSGRQHLTNGLTFSSEAAISESGPSQTWEDAVLKADKKASNIAFQSSLELTVNSSFELSAGYFFNGPAFRSAGSPFLMPNRQGASFKVNGGIWEGKLQTNLEVRYGKEIDKDVLGYSFSDFQLIGGGAYYFSKGGLLSFQFMPNLLAQSGGQSAENHLYVVSGALPEVKLAKGVSAKSFFSIANFRTEFELSDSIRSSSSVNVSAQETVAFSPNDAINLRYNMSLTRGGAGASWLAQAGYQYIDGQLSGMFGVQALNDWITPEEQVGAVIEVSCPLWGGASFFTMMNYRINIKSPGPPKGYLVANANLIMSF